ncbi:MAG: bifunctional metallophosphatase/5'-nucleotidase [Acidimicrobiia bacterium]|nr:bifunctional metallophosphatase/5'-nucleotidase [Acidimicrobiia bacterium]
MGHRRHLIALAAGALLAAALAPAASATARGATPPGGAPTTTTEAPTSTTGPVPTPVEVQLLALNDFHGNLEEATLAIDPATGSSSSPGSVPAGGAAHLASTVRALEEGVEHSLVVSAGDLIGASPLLSALFHDEPTIEAMNLIGLDLNAVGNHEFDEGADELLRMQEGGCHPADGCLDGDEFAGADFELLAANVLDTATGEPFFAPYAVREFGAARVAFIGMTLEGTPSIVSPSGVAGLEFRDEADTVNALIPELEATEDVDAVVVLLHEGGVQTGEGPQGVNDCTDLTGPVVDIVDRLSDEVDLVLSGHTHQAYDCVLGDKVVTSASSFGRVLTDIGLTIDTVAGEVTAISTENLVVTRELGPDGAVQQLITKYQLIAEPLANRVIGSTIGEILREANAAGESPLGDVIADAQLAATTSPELGGALVAFMNPGGIRADLNAPETGEAEVTYGESFTVQPFGNSLVTLTLTGEQVDQLLEQQFCNTGTEDSPETRRVLQVSAGFTYTWDQSAPCGGKVGPATTLIGGAPVDPAAAYRATVNSFLADGGDNFRVLREGTDRLGGALDTDALEAYFEASSPVAPGPADRITVSSATPPATTTLATTPPTTLATSPPTTATAAPAG